LPRYSCRDAISRLERGVVRYELLKGICDVFFIFKREKQTSHRLYLDPYTAEYVNIQSGNSGDAKRYQQKQVTNLLRRSDGVE